MCDYEGRDFGAWYIDSCCIDGYLWDLDSGGTNDNGEHYLDNGGDIPCRQCNTAAYCEYISDSIFDMGFESSQQLTTKQRKNAFCKMPSNLRRRLIKYWRQGRKESIK